MSKHVQALQVPPKFPKTYDLWTREDGQQFTYNDQGWWVRVKESRED